MHIKSDVKKKKKASENHSLTENVCIAGLLVQRPAVLNRSVSWNASNAVLSRLLFLIGRETKLKYLTNVKKPGFCMGRNKLIDLFAVY